MDEKEKSGVYRTDKGPANDKVLDREEASAPEIQKSQEPQQGMPKVGTDEPEIKIEQLFTFQFVEKEVDLILRALGDLPTKDTFHLVTKIFIEVDKQRTVVQP